MCPSRLLNTQAPRGSRLRRSCTYCSCCGRPLSPIFAGGLAEANIAVLNLRRGGHICRPLFGKFHVRVNRLPVFFCLLVCLLVGWLVCSLVCVCLQNALCTRSSRRAGPAIHHSSAYSFLLSCRCLSSHPAVCRSSIPPLQDLSTLNETCRLRRSVPGDRVRNQRVRVRECEGEEKAMTREGGGAG